MECALVDHAKADLFAGSKRRGGCRFITLRLDAIVEAEGANFFFFLNRSGTFVPSYLNPAQTDLARTQHLNQPTDAAQHAFVSGIRQCDQHQPYPARI